MTFQPVRLFSNRQETQQRLLGNLRHFIVMALQSIFNLLNGEKATALSSVAKNIALRIKIENWL
jgi:hypothetical protein